MNLLPIATPTAAANIAGTDDPAAAGAGDFTALLAMLVGAASTTLPIVEPPADQNDAAASLLPSAASASGESAAGLTVPELPAAPVAAMPVASISDTTPSPTPAATDGNASPAEPAVRPQPPKPALPAQPAVPAQPALPAQPPRTQPADPAVPAPAELPAGSSTPTHGSAAHERRSETMTLPEPARFERPPLGDPLPPRTETADRPAVPAGPPATPAPVVPLVAAARAEAPAPVETPPATPVEPPALPDQIVSAVVPLHGRGDGRHEVTLELRPDQLGTIRVEVSVEDQTVHLTLHAAEPATSRLLSASLPELRAALAEAGLTAGDVSVGLDGGGGARQRRARPRVASESSDPRLADTRGRTSTIRSARPAAAGRLDLFL